MEGKNSENDTGCTLDKLDDKTLAMWNNWKTKQINSFVGEVSCRLRKIKPDIQISADVFGGDRRKRINSIQQDWETWVDKGWVDVLNPMIYSQNTEGLTENIDYFNKSVGNKALIYPGIAIKQLDDNDLLDQIYTIKDYGLIGNTIFAMAYLDPEKAELLAKGPYRFKEAQTPDKDPVKSAETLINEFCEKLNKIKLNSSKESLTYNYSLDRLIEEADIAQNNISSLLSQSNPENIADIIKRLQNLKYLTKNWLERENETKPVRVKLLTGYLEQTITLLSYEQHRQNIRNISKAVPTPTSPN